MIKKIVFMFSALLLSVSAYAAKFEQGTHYTVLPTAKSQKPVVTEYFSFYCPHCYRFEGVVESMKKSLPEEARFEKVHVSFMGGQMGVPVAKAYATMVSLDAEKTMVPAMFTQIHEKRKAPQTEAELRQLFIDNGVDAKKYDAAYNSFAVNSMQKRFDKQFKESTLTGVPGVIVNNKYIVKADKITSIQEYNELVNYLLTL
ncbi:thiol:disulfide interchange protein DsbA/DsbL [Vibrio vulnificus]|nr:thiol:disulfide interchange protein DsbA/DsbL [Vibrio vulnificus]EHH1181818.1 thiol:disulfide interchange protein DsbA/DsbL [Vibrio vulnificus]EHH1189863.1 thiol:disulfide interchange protein DsbA/DsbL [Vibrio vulnificus]